VIVTCLLEETANRQLHNSCNTCQLSNFSSELFQSYQLTHNLSVFIGIQCSRDVKYTLAYFQIIGYLHGHRNRGQGGRAMKVEFVVVVFISRLIAFNPDPIEDFCC